MRAAVLALLTAVVLSGCNNSCQRLCVRMKTFAEDCGHTVSDAELDACIDQEDAASSEDKDVCSEFGDLGSIQTRWDCEVAGDYWGGGGGS